MLLIFDVDGTLIDSRAFILESARRTFAGGTIPHPGDDAFLATIGLLPERMMDRLFPERTENERHGLAERFIEAFWALRAERPDAEPPYAGIDGLLTKLTELRFTLGIATGKKRVGVDHMFVHTGWGDRFATIQTAESGPSKPDPTLIRNALAETGHPAGDTVMIGDSVFDMEMVRAAGVTAIGVGWGYNPLEALAKAGADHLVDSVSELDDLLATLRRPE